VSAGVSHLSCCLARWLSVYRDRIDPSAPILLAVSGGSDSLALLYAAADLAKDTDIQFQTATVDHGLRPEAADEAEYVARICSDLGILHRTLKLEWDENVQVSQAQARHARYTALSAASRDIGASVIFTGHTLDDQLETVFMRLSKNSDVWGLAGMAELSPMPVWPEGGECCLGRPLLTEARETLRSCLTDQTVGWINDPSNDEDRFERVRTRRILSGSIELQKKLLAICRLASVERASLCARLFDWVDQHLTWHLGGAASLDLVALKTLSMCERCRLLQILLACVSGRSRGPDLNRLEASLRSEEALAKGLTLGGCLLKAGDEQLQITAELPEDDFGTCVEVGDHLIWEGRILLKGESLKWNAPRLASFSERSVPSHLREVDLPVFAIRRTLPVILSDDGVVLACPHLEPHGKYTVADIGKERARALLSHNTELFRQENGLGESFSASSSTMLQTDE
tara:strand:- start:42702 stop:44075 length:1374 start_codon:yes stop_codon:yes gene_type:complete